LSADVRERIAKFLMEYVITSGEKFNVDDAMWAEIMYGD
jgi:hypothetical protein